MSNPETVEFPGKVKICQDTGASITTDTLLIASALSAAPGSAVFDLGCGTGGASIYGASLNPGCIWTGIDIRHKPLKLMLSAIDSLNNPIDIAAVCCSIETVPLTFSSCIADAVIMNPPYNIAGSARQSPVEERSRSRNGTGMLLYHFIRSAAHLLVQGGRFLIINRPFRLPDIILGCRASSINPIEIQPVGLPGEAAELIILKGRKGSRQNLRILPQLGARDLIRSSN